MDLVIDLISTTALLVLFSIDTWMLFYLFTKCLLGLIRNLAGKNSVPAGKKRIIVAASTCLSFLLPLVLFCDLSNISLIPIVVFCDVIGIVLSHVVVNWLNTGCKCEQDCIEDFAHFCSTIENWGIASSSARMEFEMRLAAETRGMSRIELDDLLQKILENSRRYVDRIDAKRNKLDAYFGLGVSMCSLIAAVWGIVYDGYARSLTIVSGDTWPLISLTVLFFMILFIIEIYRIIEMLDNENGARIQTRLLIGTIEEMQFKLLLAK